MAYVANLEDQKKKEEEQGVGEQTSGQGSLISGSGDMTQMQSNEAAQESKKGGGSGWTNLQTYLGANKDNDASMARGIAGTQEKNIGEARQAFSELGQETSSLRSDMQQSIAKQQQAEQQLQSDPSSMTRAEFDKYYNRTYQGPTQAEGLQGYQDATSKAENLQDIAQRSNQFGGVSELLRETYGDRPDYTRGQNTLDTFITRQGEQGQQALHNLKQQYTAESQNLMNQMPTYQSQLTDIQGMAGDARNQFRSATNQAMSDYTNRLNSLQSGLGQNLGLEKSNYTTERDFIDDYYIGDAKNRTAQVQDYDIAGLDQFQSELQQAREQEAQIQALNELLGQQYYTQDWNALESDIMSRIEAEKQAQLDKDFEDAIKVLKNMNYGSGMGGGFTGLPTL